MGEVRVAVKLTNALDEALARRGQLAAAQVRVYETQALVLGDEVLIGQTVLGKLDLLVDCATQQLVPNPAHPDQPVSKVK
jgi:hypothetical protein